MRDDPGIGQDWAVYFSPNTERNEYEITERPQYSRLFSTINFQSFERKLDCSENRGYHKSAIAGACLIFLHENYSPG